VSPVPLNRGWGRGGKGEERVRGEEGRKEKRREETEKRRREGK